MFPTTSGQPSGLRKGRKNYTPEQQKEIVARVQEIAKREGIPIKVACRKVGIHDTSYSKWNKKLKSDKLQSPNVNNQESNKEHIFKRADEEIAKLRARVKELEPLAEQTSMLLESVNTLTSECESLKRDIADIITGKITTSDYVKKLIR